MRNRALNDQLKGFAERVGEHLNATLEAGAEIPFEVAENPGSHSVLYHYRPLSGQFLRERFSELRGIEGFDATVSALARVDGTSAFLRSMGASYTPAGERDRAEEVLKELLARVWDEVAAFDLEGSRFERAYLRFESIVYEDTVVNTVLAPLLGVRLAGDRWDIGSGMALVRGDLCEAPAEAVWATGRDDGEPNALLVLTVESTPQEPPPFTAARLDFRKLLTALRLFKAGPANLGPSAWWRTDDGPWQSLALGFAGRSRGGEYWLEPSERVEFCELFELMRSRAGQGGPLAWALSRFELGLEQPVAIDGLSDHLLALRALLDGGEPTAIAMSQRLAALCAEGDQRSVLQDRIEQAFALERQVMRGELDAAHGDSPDRIAHGLETCMRAVLRDMVCGHIDHNVRVVADRMIGVSPSPAVEPEPPRKRRFVREPKTEPALDGWHDVETAPITEPTATPEPGFIARRLKPEEHPTAEEPATEETTAIGGIRELRGDDETDDWGFGDDPADYSAAI